MCICVCLSMNVCVCMDARRYVVMMMIDEWIGRWIVFNCPVSSIAVKLTSASPYNAALKREPSSSDILFVGLHANIVERNVARERQVAFNQTFMPLKTNTLVFHPKNMCKPLNLCVFWQLTAWNRYKDIVKEELFFQSLQKFRVISTHRKCCVPDDYNRGLR